MTRCRPLGVLHPQREDHREEGGRGAGRRILPHRRHAEHRREGEGGSPPSQWLTETTQTTTSPVSAVQL